MSYTGFEMLMLVFFSSETCCFKLEQHLTIYISGKKKVVKTYPKYRVKQELNAFVRIVDSRGSMHYPLNELEPRSIKYNMKLHS